MAGSNMIPIGPPKPNLDTQGGGDSSGASEDEYGNGLVSGVDIGSILSPALNRSNDGLSIDRFGFLEDEDDLDRFLRAT